MNISHIAIWVKDIENIKKFYVKYFNCKCNDKYINNKKGFESYFLSFENGSKIEIMIIKRNEVINQNLSSFLSVSLHFTNTHITLKTNTSIIVIIRK